MTDKKKTVLISGATGLIGSALCAHLAGRGHAVRVLSRSDGDVTWDPAAGEIDAGAVAEADCVVHLAGEPIARRWTAATRRRILESRVNGTRLLAREIRDTAVKPDFVCASGVNYYGYRPADVVDEAAPSGEGFLAEVCRRWEAAAEPIEAEGARTAYLRTGLVLAGGGGALARMLPAFKAGLGGRIGDGRQKMSWIGLGDLVRMYARAIEDPSVRGAYNAVAPKPVTNRAFAETLARVLGKRVGPPMPKFAVKALFGPMGEETLLADLGVVTRRWPEQGFEWETPELEDALRVALEI